MSDDAEFDAFLNGEGELARRLQGVAQPSPSAALDAAILASARAAMAQEARPAAANDSGDGAPAPRLAPGLGWRWRVPAGIAASVLVGVFAVQTFEAGGDLNETAAPVPEAAAERSVVVPTMPAAPAAPAKSAGLPAAENMAPAPAPQMRSSPAPSKAKVPAPVIQAEPAPVESVESYAPPAAPAPAPALAFDMARPAMPARQSKPAPVLSEQAKSANMDSVVIEGYRRAQVQAAPAPVSNYAPSQPPEAAAQKPWPPVATLDSEDKQIAGMVAPAPAASANMAPMSAPAWLHRIEALLAQGQQPEAVAQWKAFRKVYPDYPVTAATRSQLE